ncbi:MAG: glycosyltransferase family 2 protein [Leptolyngbya sp. ERB_1_1]
MMTVSIILVNYNGAQVTIDCLHSIRNQLHTVPYEVIVVDNASTDQSADSIESTFPEVKLLRQSENRGFGAGNNIGARIASGEYLFLLNTDTILTCDLLPHLIEVMEQDPTIGIVGPKLLNLDGSLQLSTARSISLWGEYQDLKQKLDYRKPTERSRICKQFETIQEVDIVIGAALFVRKDLFEDLGGFDETFFMYFEESDLCQRAQEEGWKIVYTPSVNLIHLGGHSVNQTADRLRLEYRRSQIYYYQKHRPRYEQLILRCYLAVKFAYAALRSSQTINLEILRLILNLNLKPGFRS